MLEISQESWQRSPAPRVWWIFTRQIHAFSCFASAAITLFVEYAKLSTGDEYRIAIGAMNALEFVFLFSEVPFDRTIRTLLSEENSEFFPKILRKEFLINFSSLCDPKLIISRGTRDIAMRDGVSKLFANQKKIFLQRLLLSNITVV